MSTSQVQFSPNPLTASVDAVIQDNNNSPIEVLEVDQPWSVHIELTVNAGGLFDGFCHFVLWADEVAGPHQGPLGEVVLQVPGDGTFPIDLPVAANHPLLVAGDVKIGEPPHLPKDSGIYEMVLVMTHHNQPPGVGLTTETTAIVDFGIVRVS